MSQIAKVEPLFIREYNLTREVVCRVTVYTGLKLPQARIMYFDADISQDDLEAAVAGATECDQIQVQTVFYLPVTRGEDSFEF